MAEIFIAYSTKDELFARQLAKSLTTLGANVFIAVEGSIPAGSTWPDTIQQELDLCKIMLLVVTPDSMQSKNVKTEWQYFFNKDKEIIPVVLERADVSFQLHSLQYIDFEKYKYEVAFEQLHSELRREKITLTNLPVATPLVTIPEQAKLPLKGRLKINWGRIVRILVIPLFIAIVAALIETWPAIIALLDNRTPKETPTLDIPSIVGTLDAQATIDQATANAENTAIARITEYAVGTKSSFDQTATATLWTQIPTPDITASIDAYRTQQADTATAQFIDNWTDTPTPTLTPLEQALNQAKTMVNRNAQWENLYSNGFEYEFDRNNVTMVLVPAGCFTIGANSLADDEENGNEVCFNEPFWIDQTEVTQEQFRRLRGIAANEPTFLGDSRPVESITWFEARNFCDLRDARLPTEAEWEYAARGPNELNYPWGNTWNANLAVWNRSSSQGTSLVGVNPAGASWVGAFDMSGNVWEWTQSLYEPYPYDKIDGREASTGIRTDVERVLRGGAWFATLSQHLRSAIRSKFPPDNRYLSVGFRCARSID
jgi:formylglycine-generating enzyme required for sulfatase activity